MGMAGMAVSFFSLSSFPFCFFSVALGVQETSQFIHSFILSFLLSFISGDEG
jgi:hypothetical protein